MADEEHLAEEAGAAAAGQKSKTLLLIIGVALLALAGGGGAAWFILKAPGAADASVAVDGEAGADVAEQEVAEVPATPYYFSLNPPFVVNFVGNGRARFLQVNVEGLTRDARVKEDITTHLPQIRNNVVFILSSKRQEDLVTPAGKEDLRKQVLGEIRNILKKETGNSDVEDIYFTSFVIQ